MIRPRPYLSFSQMTTFEQSPARFVKQYLYKEEQRINRNMAYGSKMADGLENEEATGDPLLDLMMARLPKFGRMDKPVESGQGTLIQNPHDKKMYCVPVLPNGKEEGIPLLALPDTATKNYSAFKEYKTSVRKWTQRMADDSGQITFYTTAIWLATREIPEDIELVNVQVEYDEEGKLRPTGDIWRIPTKRNMVDVIRMTGRMKRAWAGIKKLCEEELL